MAKSKKVETTSEELPIVQEDKVEPILGVEKPIYIPDMPAQMTDEQAASVEELIMVIVPPLMSEVDFLQHLLHLQNSGGWGKFLDEPIKERIKQLS